MRIVLKESPCIRYYYVCVCVDAWVYRTGTVRLYDALGGRSPGGGVWGANSTSFMVGDLESGATAADGRVQRVVRAQRRPSTSAAGQRHFHHPSSAAAARTGLNHPRSIFRRHNHVVGFISSVFGVNNSSPTPPPHAYTTHSHRGSFRQLLSEPNRKRTAERVKSRKNRLHGPRKHYIL